MNPLKVASAIKELKRELGGGLVSVTLSDEAMSEFDKVMGAAIRFPDDPPHEQGPWEINGVAVAPASLST